MGGHVILSDCKDNSATHKTIEAEGGSARVQTVDLADASSVDGLFQSIRDTEGNLDFVVNAAGILSEGTVVDMSISEFDRIISVNLRGSFLIAKGAAQIMAPAKSGRIILISSELLIWPL